MLFRDTQKGPCLGSQRKLAHHLGDRCCEIIEDYERDKKKTHTQPQFGQLINPSKTEWAIAWLRCNSCFEQIILYDGRTT